MTESRASAIEVNPQGPHVEMLRLVSPRIVAGQLQDAGALGGSGPVHLEMVPGNPDRQDFGTRVSFRVYRSRKPVCFLTIGRNLRDLWMRTKKFADACPTISCKPLFHRKTRHWDLVGVEYFDGTSLESLVASGCMSADAAMATTEKVMSILEETTRRSHIEAAAREFDSFSAMVLTSGIFDVLDQGFLRNIVLPFVRDGALKGPHTTRWSNGDFIARNILVDSKGGVRLIDHEFARRTHFHGDDLWRWKIYTNGPGELRDPPSLHGSGLLEPWQQVYSILRQVILAHRVNGARLAIAEAEHHLKEVVAIVAGSYLNFRSSVFYRQFSGAEPPPGILAASSEILAQLFWSSNGNFSEETSKRSEYSAHDDAFLRFVIKPPAGKLRLRFDPTASVGMIRISSIRVHSAVSNDAVYSAIDQSGWNNIEFGGGMLRLADSPDLNILCLDTDPWLLLPEIEIGKESEELTVEIALRFSSELRALPDLLQFPALLDPEKVDAERTALQEAAANSRAKLEATTQRAKELEEQLGAAKLELEQRLNTAIADAIDARGDHRLATQHAEHLEQQVAKLREEATKVELEATQQVELEESLNAANSEIEKLKTEKLELEQKLDTALADATDARDNHRLATQHAENLEQQLAKLRVEAATHEDTLAQAKVDFARFEQNKVELEDLLLIESTEATQAKKQLELVKQHSAVLEIQVANLRAELALKERSFAVAAEESARLTKSHTEIESRLKSEAEELQREVLRLAGEMAARESAIAALREAEASAQKLNRELTSELRTVRDSAAELARSARALESDLALSKDSNEEMLASLLAQNRAIHEVEHRAELLAAEHNRLVVESEDAARREAALTAELESARAALTELREHVEAINRRPLVRFDAALRRKFTPAQETGNDGIQQ